MRADLPWGERGRGGKGTDAFDPNLGSHFSSRTARKQAALEFRGHYEAPNWRVRSGRKGTDAFSWVTKGSAPAMSMTYDPATNRPVGENYDANGNAPIGVWDVENRLVSQTLDGQAVTWGYDAAGKRVMKYQVVNGQPNWTYWIYDIGGREVLQIACTNQSCTTAGAKIYFGGRMIAATDPSGRLLASTDRLGSVRAVNTNGTWTTPSFFPYGEEKTPVAADGVTKFATYTRDSTLSNQDYADHRYYSNLMGRFYSPDPSMLSVDLADSGSWNMYGYVRGDPVNNTDPSGLFLPATYCSRYRTDPLCNSSDISMPSVPDVRLMISEAEPVGPRGLGAYERTAVSDAAHRAADRLFAADCAGLFLSPEANTADQRKLLASQLDYIADRGDLRIISKGALPPGTPSSVPAFTTDTMGYVYVVSGGSFFTNMLEGKPLGGALQDLPLAATQELIMIHEYLHWGGIGPDNAGQNNQMANGDIVVGSAGISQEVRDKCFK